MIMHKIERWKKKHMDFMNMLKQLKIYLVYTMKRDIIKVWNSKNEEIKNLSHHQLSPLQLSKKRLVFLTSLNYTFLAKLFITNSSELIP